MSYKFIVGQKLIIELVSGDVFEGEFVSSSSTWLELKNCMNAYTQMKNSAIQYFYHTEIADLKAFSPEEPENNKVVEIRSEPHQPIIKIAEVKYLELKALRENYIYLSTMDVHYYKAVHHLLNCETIGAAILSSRFGRAAPIELLALSSWDQVYLFDMSTYNCKHFPTALKHIMECDDIIKVVHDSRAMLDCLHHQYSLKVTNIFDTFVAAHMVSDITLILSECLSFYFNFPTALIKEAFDEKLCTEWKKRPLTNDMKQKAAIHVQYLIFLKNYLQKQLLKEFNDRVLKHSRSTIELSHLNAETSLGRLNSNK